MNRRIRDLSPLTARQIKGMCALASLAFRRARERAGMDDGDTVETFRHREQLAATRCGSLKEMNQGHYRVLKAHWLTLIGLLGEAYDLLIKTGEGQEQRELIQYQLAGCAANIAYAFQVKKGQPVAEAVDGAWRYILAIAADKFGGKAARDLTLAELVQLRDTATNRFNAMMGRGSSAGRNKKQRTPAE